MRRSSHDQEFLLFSMAGHDSLHVDGGLLCQEPLATEVIAGQVRQGGGHDGNTHDSESFGQFGP